MLIINPRLADAYDEPTFYKPDPDAGIVELRYVNPAAESEVRAGLRCDIHVTDFRQTMLLTVFGLIYFKYNRC